MRVAPPIHCPPPPRRPAPAGPVGGSVATVGPQPMAGAPDPIAVWLERGWQQLRGLIDQLSAAVAAPPAAGAAPAAPATYTVQPGDSLSGIALKVLGDLHRWPELQALNADLVPNPNLIYAGQVLRLPGGPAAPAPVAAVPAPAPSGRWAWPVEGRITSNFGHRADPASGRTAMHTGLDIGAAMGTPVRSPLGGVVSFAGWQEGGGGNMIIVDHGDGLQTVYAHLSAIQTGVGQAIAAGQTIGAVGSTGYSTGPHLHFEVKRNGQHLDPLTVLG